MRTRPLASSSLYSFFISLFFIPQSLNFIILSPLFQIFVHFFSIYINHLLIHYILYYYTILSDKMFCVFYEYRSFSDVLLQIDAILLSFSICIVSSSLIFYFYLDSVHYRDCLYYFLSVSLFYSHIFSFFFCYIYIFVIHIFFFLSFSFRNARHSLFLSQADKCSSFFLYLFCQTVPSFFSQISSSSVRWLPSSFVFLSVFVETYFSIDFDSSFLRIFQLLLVPPLYRMRLTMSLLSYWPFTKSHQE